MGSSFIIYGFIGLIIGFVCALIAGEICSSKGRYFFEGFILGFILGIIGIIIAAVLPSDNSVLEGEKLTSGSYKRCPYCAETIKVEARVCRYCGKDVSGTLPSFVNVNLAKSNWDTITGIIESECPWKGKDWVNWGESIVQTIRANTNQRNSSKNLVSMVFSTKN